MPKNRFVDIEQLIIKGRFKEAQDLLAKIEKSKGISKEDLLTSQVLNAEILNHLGDFQNASEQIENILKEIDNQEFPLVYLDALLQKSFILYRIGKIEECSILNEKCEQLIQTLKKTPAKVLAKRKAILLHIKGAISHVKGNFDESTDYLLEALTFAEEYGNKQIISYVLSNIGLNHQFMGNLEKAEKYYDQALKLAEKIGNKQEIARAYHRFGWLYNLKFEKNQAVAYFKKSIKYALESGSKRDLPWIYADMGNLYLDMFELDKALECSQEQLTLREKDPYSHDALTTIAYINHLKGDYKQAIEYYRKALKICEEIGDKRRSLPSILYNLVQSSIENNELQQAQDYVEYLKRISNEVEEKRVDTYYKLAKALVLKTDTRIRRWVEAELIFEEILEDKELIPYFTIVALLNLTELQFRELQLSANKEELQEIKRNITKLYAIADKGQFYNLLICTLRLQSQIALVELDPQKALQLLSQALILSKDIGLKKLDSEIISEQKQINEQLKKWEGFKEEKTPFSEILKHVSLENGIKNISKEAVLEERDKKSGVIIEYRKLFALKI